MDNSNAVLAIAASAFLGALANDKINVRRVKKILGARTAPYKTMGEFIYGMFVTSTIVSGFSHVQDDFDPTSEDDFNHGTYL